MRLANAASYFDKVQVYDAYTGRELFTAQLDLYDDSERDAVSVQRRVISTPIDAVMPARRAIKVSGVPYIVGGTENADLFFDYRIRTKYILQRAVGMSYIRTPGQVVSAAGGVQAYAGLAWMKDWKESDYSNRAYPYYELFFGLGETVGAGSFLEVEGLTLRVRSMYRSEAGFVVAESDDITGARKAVTYTTYSAYDPTTDALTTSTIGIMGLVLPFFMSDFEYLRQSSPKRDEGDRICLVKKTDVAAPKSGDILVADTTSYRIMTAASESDCWRLHLRP